MVKPQTTHQTLVRPWLSGLLVVMAYATYGGFLHDLGTAPRNWAISIVVSILLAAVTTIAWRPCRHVLLLGFQSDLGYFLMALMLASLAVIAVTQFHIFTSWALLIAVSLLARVDMLIAKFEGAIAFLIMISLSMLGLGLAWIPHLLTTSGHALAG
jgi:hypothetical protein